MFRVCIAALLLAGCGPSAGKGVQITVDASQLSETLRASVDSIGVDVHGDETFFANVPLDHSLGNTERMLYRTAVTDGTVRFQLFVHSGSVNSACGLGETPVHAGSGGLRITLTPGACGGGGGTVTSSCASTAAHPDWILCDGFDHATVDPSWGIDTTAGQVTIDPATFTRGTGAARFHLDTASSDMGGDYEVARLFQGVSRSGALFVRAFVKLPGSTVNHTVENTTLLKVIHTINDGAGMYLTWNLGSQLAVRSSGSVGTFDQMGGTLSSTDWSCLEWQLPTTSGDNHVWIDEQEVTGLAGTVAFPSQLAIFVVGPDTAVATGFSADVWIDDLVLSSARVGCAN